MKIRNKKADMTFEQIAWLIGGTIVVVIVLFSLNQMGILDTLKNVIPGFENNQTQSSENPSTSVNVNINELCNNLKSEVILSDNFKKSALLQISKGNEIHVQCGASDKSRPIIYLKNTKTNLKMRWDYVLDNWEELSQEPSISPQIILRTNSDLEKILGIKS